MKKIINSVKSSCCRAGVIVGIVVLAAGIQSATAQSIGVSFVNSDNSGAGGVDNSQADSLLPAEAAGAPSYVQANWNNLSRYGIGVTLTNSAGAATALTINWDANLTSTFGTNAATGTPDGKLMADSLGGSGNATDYTTLSTYNSVYAMPGGAKPMVYVGGLNAWCSAQGAIGYTIVVYQNDNAYYGSDQMWVESVSGSPFNNTMVAGPDLTPHLWEGISPSFNNTYFNGTYSQIPATATNSSSKAYGANYGVFKGLTNDAVLIRTGTGDYENGSLNGFQIIPIFASHASVGVHFVDSSSGGLQNSAPDALSPAASAGAPGYAQKNWNNFGPTGDSVGNNTWATGPAVVLNDGSGSPTSLQISWGNAGNGATGTTNLSTSNGNLMDGFLTTYDGSTPTNMVNNGPVYFSPNANQRPLASIGGLSSWLAGYPGAVGYKVVLYYSGINFYGNVEGYVNAATGDIVSGTLTEVGAAAPHVFGQSGTFAGTFVQATGTNSGSSTAGANYMVFTGLTNDTIVIHEHMLGYQGVWNGFQIVPIFPSLPSVGVHFGNGGGTGYADGSSTDLLAPGDSAGISGYAQTNWNNLGASGDSGTVTLNDGTGAATPLSVMWSSYAHSGTGTATSPGGSDGKLMDGYLYTWGPGAATALGGSVNNGANNNPIAYVGGLQAWYQGLGAAGYNVVLYTTGGNGYEIAEGFLESVTSGNPLSNNMVEGDVLQPPLFEVDNANYSGSYIPTTGTSIASRSYGANYMEFYGLTNDAVLIRLQCVAASYGAGLNGFQIIPVASLPTVVPPVVTINSTNIGGGTNVVSWSAGTLQTATNVLGPWTYNYTPSPVTDTMTNGAKFYRVWVQK